MLFESIVLDPDIALMVSFGCTKIFQENHEQIAKKLPRIWKVETSPEDGNETGNTPPLQRYHSMMVANLTLLFRGVPCLNQIFHENTQNRPSISRGEKNEN